MQVLETSQFTQPMGVDSPEFWCSKLAIKCMNNSVHQSRWHAVNDRALQESNVNERFDGVQVLTTSRTHIKLCC